MGRHAPGPQVNHRSIRKTKPLSRCDGDYDNTCPRGQEDTLEKQPNSFQMLRKSPQERWTSGRARFEKIGDTDKGCGPESKALKRSSGQERKRMSI